MGMLCYRECITFCRTLDDPAQKVACMSGCGIACQGAPVTDEKVVEAEPVILAEPGATVANSFADAAGVCFEECIGFCQALEPADQINPCIQGCGAVCHRAA